MACSVDVDLLPYAEAVAAQMIPVHKLLHAHPVPAGYMAQSVTAPYCMAGARPFFSAALFAFGYILHHLLGQIDLGVVRIQ